MFGGRGGGKALVAAAAAGRRALSVFEPFKMKSVEPIRMTTREERVTALRKAHFNPFLLESRDVMVDLLTDSGTGAMSAAQWGAIMTGDESYAGASSFGNFKRMILDVMPNLSTVFPVHQGRAAERILNTILAGPGRLIPSNTHFDTTRANIEFTGAEALDLPCPEASDMSSDFPFKGNMDLAALSEILDTRGANIPYVAITVTNNARGGQPVAMANIRAVSELAKAYGKPFFIDGCRFAENAFFIKKREAGYASKTVHEICTEMFALSNGMWMSAKKDAIVNIGGWLCLDESMEELATQVQDFVILGEGFITYGGLAGRDLDAMAVGMREGMDEDYLAYRLGNTAWLGDALTNLGVPIIRPVGGHAIFVDAAAFLPHITPLQYPGHALACALYVEGGVVHYQGSIIPTKFSERHYFDCHRTGKMRLLSREKRMTHRANNLHPTRKIGFTCSAHIYVSVGNEMASSKRVSVVFCRHHYGHDRALHWLPIPDTARDRIQDLLARGYTREEVYLEMQREARDQAARRVPGADRLALISRHDVANMEKQLQLRPQREAKRRQKEDVRKRKQAEELRLVAEKEREKSVRRATRMLTKADARASPRRTTVPRATATATPREIRTTTRSGRKSKFDENMRRIMAWENSGVVIPPPEPSASAPSSSKATVAAAASTRELSRKRREWQKSLKDRPQGQTELALVEQLKSTLGRVEAASLEAGSAESLRLILRRAEELAVLATSLVGGGSLGREEEFVEMGAEEVVVVTEEEEEVEVEEEPTLHLPHGLRLTSVSNQPITVQAIIDTPHHSQGVYGQTSGGFV